MTFDFRNHLTTQALAMEALVKALKEKNRFLLQRILQPVTLTSSIGICALTLLGAFSTSSYTRHVFTALLTTFLMTQRNSPSSFAWTASFTGPLFRNSPHTPATMIIHNPQSGSSSSILSSPPLIHFIFLVHGYKGMSADLSYLQHNLKSIIEQRVFENTTNNNLSPPYKVVIHNAVSNELRTKDGVGPGGDRLLEEMLNVIRTHVSQLRQSATDSTHVTLSIIGNSLGGLYSRYAVAKLAAMSKHVKNSTHRQDTFLIDNGSIHIHFNVFCSTATPHLGIARHTWLKIPRLVEVYIAHLLGETGKDLFLMTDIVKEMTTVQYLRPLAAFRRRILYANAFHTDFVVPCQTASFLHVNSKYPHHSFSEDDASNNNRCEKGHVATSESVDQLSPSSQKDVSNRNRLFVTTLHTLPTSHPTLSTYSHLSSSTFVDSSDYTTSTSHPSVNSRQRWRDFGITPTWEWKTYDSVDDNVLLEMSQSLDALGWKKVFIDVRETIPIRLPLPNLTKLSSRNIFGKSVNASNMFFQKQPGQTGVFESGELAQALSLPDKVMAFPVGHNMMVAFSRTPLSSYFNRGGRPVVDQLAFEFVEEMINWRFNDK